VVQEEVDRREQTNEEEKGSFIHRVSSSEDKSCGAKGLEELAFSILEAGTTKNFRKISFGLDNCEFIKGVEMESIQKEQSMHMSTPFLSVVEQSRSNELEKEQKRLEKCRNLEELERQVARVQQKYRLDREA
jgi:hypothetical protein